MFHDKMEHINLDNLFLMIDLTLKLHYQFHIFILCEFTKLSSHVIKIVLAF